MLGENGFPSFEIHFNHLHISTTDSWDWANGDDIMIPRIISNGTITPPPGGGGGGEGLNRLIGGENDQAILRRVFFPPVSLEHNVEAFPYSSGSLHLLLPLPLA